MNEKYCQPGFLETIAEDYLRVFHQKRIFPFWRKLAYENYKHNLLIEKQSLKRYFPQGPLTDQRKLTALKFGIREMGYAGCEVLAIYNAILVATGKTPVLSELIRECELSGAARLAGEWGTDVYRIGELLQKNGLGYKVIKRAGELRMDPKKLYIISFWNERNIFRGIHTALFRVQDQKQLLGYNYVYADGPVLMQGSFEDILHTKPFIIGYEIVL